MPGDDVSQSPDLRLQGSDGKGGLGEVGRVAAGLKGKK